VPVNVASRDICSLWCTQQSQATSTFSKAARTIDGNVMPTIAKASQSLLSALDYVQLRGFGLRGIVVQRFRYERRYINFHAFVGDNERMLQQLHVVRTLVVVLLQAEHTNTFSSEANKNNVSITTSRYRPDCSRTRQ